MSNTTIKVALIGNPNVGKTSVFNQLTGLNQQVGNYPGITVEKKEGISKLSTLAKAKSLTGKGSPIMIMMNTQMGNGVDFMMGTHKWHGVAPNDEQLKSALAQNPETLGDY